LEEKVSNIGSVFFSECWWKAPVAAVCLAALVAKPALAYPPQKTDDLTSQSIQDLMNLEVTSVSKTEQKLARTAAAVFVITPEDIRRSGATDIPDLLRMVPGMDVSQINANTWAISARGFNEEFSDKLLVMIDGRSVYTPTFAGVFWDSLDLPLADIERIEVIRGPGGSLWGANAVNGVINVITKSAGATQGGSAVAGGGNLAAGFGTVQYGGHAGKSTDYRVYAKFFNQSSLPDLTGAPGGDAWRLSRGGFRSDSKLSTNDNLTVEGDLYGGREGQELIAFGSNSATRSTGSLGGGYLQTVWDHAYSGGSTSALQISYDRNIHNVPFRDNRGTLNADFQYHFAWGSRQSIAVGGGYRYTSHNSNSASVSYLASDNIRQFFSSFFQDEIAVIPDRVYFTVGIRLEHNEYTGLLALPDLRASWQPDARNTIWAAVSSAKRIPSSGDTSDYIVGAQLPVPGGLPEQLVLTGNPNFRNERLLAYETGYRAGFLQKVTLDFTAFYNVYNSLRTIELQTPFVQTLPTPVLILPFQFRNEMQGEAHGVEISANWKPTSRWTLSPGYAFERLHMRLDPGSTDDILFLAAQGGSPNQSAQIRSHLDLVHGLSWDTSAYFVDRLQSLNVPAYTRVDMELTMRFTERDSFSVVGQNLESDHRIEYRDLAGLVQSQQVKRSVYGMLTIDF
jgi:iron complex outermembrane receptor protein